MKILGIILIILGGINLIFSLLFKLTHWPGVGILFISGFIMFTLGLIIRIKEENK